MKNENMLTNLFKSIREKIEFSIRRKLSLKYIKILVGVMLAAGLGVLLVFGAITIRDNVTKDYLAIANTLSHDSIGYPDVRKYSEEHNLPVLIYDQNKNLIFAAGPDMAQYGYKSWIGVVRTEKNLYLALNRSSVIFDVPARVVIYSDIREELGEGLKLAEIILIVFSIILFFAVIAIALSGRGIFEPIREMTRTVKEISEKNLNLRLNVSGSKNELKELALTFNEMMNRIEDHYNRQKQFVSDASHELRTPIAVIQGYADMLDRWGKNDKEVLQESIDAIKNEAENMRELIDKLLFLARHDNSTFVFQKEEFSLTEMLSEIIKETQIIDSTHMISSDINQEVSLNADKIRMKQAIRIFIDNALKYTPAGGKITVSLGKEGNSIAVSIKDTGIGMTKEELEHVFDRFYRVDQSRTKDKGGHGLGLAIAKIIILGHNGKLKVRSKVGEGSEFIILLDVSTS
ncbi:sensor histidine kinase [Desulfitobacterium sp. Sab5]|uniref:sensor histidine kinase n=1 Tax=Desulfitobacterium nosdiversum TaxID=3375356 RepID=UPI003CFAB5B8